LADRFRNLLEIQCAYKILFRFILILHFYYTMSGGYFSLDTVYTV